MILGHVGEQAGTTPMFGTNANVWTVDVEEWLAGDGPSRIEVISPPDTCGPGNPPYFGEDQFEEARHHDLSVIFLSGEPGSWRGMSPLQGVVAATPEGDLPAGWTTSPCGTGPPS